jgi:hypothetical protein
MFEIKKALEISEIEKRHDYMLSVINGRIENASKYERERFTKYGKSRWSRTKRDYYNSRYFPTERKILKGCKHEIISN